MRTIDSEYLYRKREDKYSDELEIELSLPSFIYDCKTGKAMEMNLYNPAHYAMKVLYDCHIIYDCEEFIEWGKYCDENKLRIPELSEEMPNYGITLLDIMCNISKYGRAMMYWNGEIETLKVIYGLPKNMIKGRNVYMTIIDDTYSTETLI